MHNCFGFWRSKLWCILCISVCITVLLCIYRNVLPCSCKPKTIIIQLIVHLFLLQVSAPMFPKNSPKNEELFYLHLSYYSDHHQIVYSTGIAKDIFPVHQRTRLIHVPSWLDCWPIMCLRVFTVNEAQAAFPFPFGSKRNFKAPKCPPDVAEMRKLPWRKLHIWVEQPVLYNNIHSCEPRPIFYFSLILNVLWLQEPKRQRGESWLGHFYCEYSKYCALSTASVHNRVKNTGF